MIAVCLFFLQSLRARCIALARARAKTVFGHLKRLEKNSVYLCYHTRQWKIKEMKIMLEKESDYLKLPCYVLLYFLFPPFFLSEQ